MADGTSIEWTDATWNPIRARSRATGKVGWFCTHKSPGCANCYAEPINNRLGTGVPYKPGHAADAEVFLDEGALLKPLSWRRPRMIFPGSMTDLFGAFVTDAMLDRIFAVMALCPQHVFQVLTKRPERMRAYISDPKTLKRVLLIVLDTATTVSKQQELASDFRWPLPNVWLGVSVEDQRRADERRAHLAECAAAGWTTFVSYEPALGAVDWTGWEFLRWLIAGGESGPKARPAHPDWFRGARDFCLPRGIAFLFKQWGAYAPRQKSPGVLECGGARQPDVAWPDGTIAHGTAREHGGQGLIMDKVGKKAAGRLLDGVTHDGFPEVRP